MNAALDLAAHELAFHIGEQVGWDAGYRRGRAEADAEWQAALTGCTDTFRRPRYAEIELARIPDYRPCAVKCGRCSRCTCSRAYWARGGRPYEGAERERARSSAA